jgi:hypothetical protein
MLERIAKVQLYRAVSRSLTIVWIDLYCLPKLRDSEQNVVIRGPRRGLSEAILEPWNISVEPSKRYGHGCTTGGHVDAKAGFHFDLSIRLYSMDCGRGALIHLLNVAPMIAKSLPSLLVIWFGCWR